MGNANIFLPFFSIYCSILLLLSVSLHNWWKVREKPSTVLNQSNSELRLLEDLNSARKGLDFPRFSNLSYLGFGGLGGTCGASKGVTNSSVQCRTPGACARSSSCCGTQGKQVVLRDSHQFFLFTYTRPFNSVLLASKLPSFLNKELEGGNLPRISFCCVLLIEERNHFELQVQSPNPL